MSRVNAFGRGYRLVANRTFRRGREMNRILLMTALVLLSSSFTGCTPTPPPQGPGGIRTNNVNTTNENAQIRLWILTQEQIANPPKTKMEAMLLDNGGNVQPRFRTFTFRRNPGTYYVVASNESHYQSLRDNAPFTPGVDFSLLEVVVRQELVPVSVRNSASPTRLPVITSP